jgi:mxaA protein
MAPGAQLVVQRFDLDSPRNFGYLIGDRFRHQLTLQLSEPYRLDAAASTLGAYRDSWIQRYPAEVRSESSGGSTIYRVSVDYQIFNNPLETTEVTTPEMVIAFTDDSNAESRSLPAWTFSVSPLLDGDVGARAGPWGLRGDHLPEPIPTRRDSLLMAGSVFLLLAASLWAFHECRGLPGTRRRNLPFARAYRRLRRLARRPFSRETFRTALRELHRAFNETDGAVVFIGGLDRFFREHQALTPLRADIEQLFNLSTAEFFDDCSNDSSDARKMERLLRLAAGCRDLERKAT